MTTFILIRHGQSEANVRMCFGGQSDPELSEKGIKQAELLSDWLVQNCQINKIYSSDLKGAYDTAKPIAERLHLKILKDNKFREIDAGNWTEQPYQELKKRYKEDYSIWLKDIGNARCTNGESVKELSQRVTQEMIRLGSVEKGKTVAIFTHATPVKAFQTVCD